MGQLVFEIELFRDYFQNLQSLSHDFGTGSISGDHSNLVHSIYSPVASAFIADDDFSPSINEGATMASVSFLQPAQRLLTNICPVMNPFPGNLFDCLIGSFDCLRNILSQTCHAQNPSSICDYLAFSYCRA